MTQLLRRTTLAAVLLAAFAVGVARASATPTPSFTAVDLGTLGGAHSRAFALNEAGQVVGWSYTAGPLEDQEVHAFSWTHGDGMVDLRTLGGSSSEATLVSPTGQVVGSSYTANGGPHAFSWTQAGGIVDIGSLGGVYSFASAVNANGQVVGRSLTSAGSQHAFSWTEAGGIVDLGTLGGSFSSANAVSDGGQVVGTSASPFGSSHAFAWTQAGGMVDLGTLAGSFASSAAYAVNSNGQVLGVSTAADGAEHAFSWTQPGGMVDLGLLGSSSGMLITGVSDSGQFVGFDRNAAGHAFSFTQADGFVDLGTLGGLTSSAWAVNAGGQVVGSSDVTGDFARHAFVWTQGSGMVDLGTLGGNVSEARDINDGGQIVGDSSGPGAFPQTHATLWNPATGDTTPPTITVPSDFAVDATSPAGVAVSYAASAVDEVDGSVAVACSPSSGRVFPIGTTQVTCTASDAAGNEAITTFNVHVKSAAEQLDDLIARVTSLRPGTSLLDKVNAAKTALGAGDYAVGCDTLQAFANEAQAQSGKKLPPALAAELVASASRIRSVLAC